MPNQMRKLIGIFLLCLAILVGTFAFIALCQVQCGVLKL